MDDVFEKLSGIAQKNLKTQAERIDQEAIWPEESIRAIQQEGLAGLTVPERFGGLGGGLFTLVRSSEILAKECASAALCFGMHCVGSAVIAAKPTEAQVEHFLLPIVKGEHITTLSLSEPGTGAHFYIPETQMSSEEGGGFTVNGTKSFVTNGRYADSYVVSTVAPEPDSPIGQFSLVVIPNGAKGLEWSSTWQGFGMRGNASSDVHLNGVVVPEENLLGQKGDQLWYMFEVVTPYFLMGMAGAYLGIADAAISEGITHLKGRRYGHSGSSLSGATVLQHRLGVLWSQLESTRQLIYHAARLGDSGNPDALPAILSAKAEVADRATEIVNEVMTLMGGKAYAANGKMGRLLRDVRAAHIMSPTTDMLRMWTGRALLGLPLLGDY